MTAIDPRFGGTGIDPTGETDGQYLVTSSGVWVLQAIIPTSAGGTGADHSAATEGQFLIASGSGGFTAGTVFPNFGGPYTFRRGFDVDPNNPFEEHRLRCVWNDLIFYDSDDNAVAGINPTYYGPYGHALSLLSTNDSRLLKFVRGSTLTVDRTLTVTTPDANTALTLGGDFTTAGAVSISSFIGGSLLNDADAATAATTLGLGTSNTPQFAGVGVGQAGVSGFFAVTFSSSGGGGLVMSPTAGGATAKGRWTSFGSPGGQLALSANGTYSGSGSTFNHDDSALAYWDAILDPRAAADRFAVRRAPVGAATAVVDWLSLDSAFNFRVTAGNNGQQWRIESRTELTTIAAAAFTDTAIQFPAGCIPLSASVRNTVAIPTATTYDVGISGNTTLFATGVAVAANTTNQGVAGSLTKQASAIAARITPSATPGANTGRVIVSITYLTTLAPTSN